MRVALYTRVSTEDQVKEGTSLEVQREFLVSYAKREGWEIYYPEAGKIYEDDGYSGYTRERPALKKLFADAKKKKIDMVLVHKIDRFSRNLRDLLNLVDELEYLNISLKSATEPYDTSSSAGKMMFQQLGSFAEFERNRIKERVFPGMLKGVQRGNWQGARYSPYGYSYNKDAPDKERVLKVVKEEAEIVKLIYTMYLSGQSTTQIAGYLYKKGYKTRSGGRFHTKLVCDILKNQIYIGKIVWNTHYYDKKQKTLKGYRYVKNEPSKVITAEGKHEAIISQNVFDVVQKKLEKNRKGVAVRKGCHEYPLTGLLVCAKCGHRFQGGRCNGSRNKKWERRYYKCSGKGTHNADCHAPYLHADKIESVVFTIFEFILSSPALKGKEIENIIAAANSVHNEDIEKEMVEWKVRLDVNLAKQQRLSQIFTDGYLAMEVFKKQIEPLRNEEREIKERLQKLKVALIEREKSSEYLNLLKAVVNHFDYLENEVDIAGKKGLLKLVFKSFIIKDGKIKSFELFEPFKGFYKRRVEFKWEMEMQEVQENQWVAKEEGSVSQLLHSAGRWCKYRDIILAILKGLSDLE